MKEHKFYDLSQITKFKDEPINITLQHKICTLVKDKVNESIIEASIKYLTSKGYYCNIIDGNFIEEAFSYFIAHLEAVKIYHKDCNSPYGNCCGCPFKNFSNCKSLLVNEYNKYLKRGYYEGITNNKTNE